MVKRKIGLFFGAGAEIPYGLPSGGRFALDIFKMNNANDKADFKQMLEEIDVTSLYASKWLPNDYSKRTITTFGKAQHEQIIISSLENKRDQIKNFLSNFDVQSKIIIDEFKKNYDVDVDKCFEDLNGSKVGSFLFTHTVKINDLLRDNIRLFDSKYFSAILKTLEKYKGDSRPVIDDLKNLVKSFIELLIGAVGEDFLDTINDSIFEKKSKSLDIFDDFSGFFKFDYNRISGLSYVLSSYKPKAENCPSNDMYIILCFVLRMLEEIFIVALDYQALIDSHFRYLYMPKTNWAKFCKISIFLMTVRSYITKDQENTRKLIVEGDGYYQDANALLDDNIHVIGTSNYNTFIETVFNKKKVIHLNGSTDDYYDPYKNRIVTNDYMQKHEHICVPFLFTQSVTKPYSSVSVSRRYVEIYDEFLKCDTIGVVGFGFNADDGYINSLFRELIEEKKKKVVIFRHSSDQDAVYAEKLRLSNPDDLIIKDISEDRKVEGTSWTDLLTRSVD